MWFYFVQEEARQTIVKQIQLLDFGKSELAVRINSLKSGEGEKDLNVIMNGEKIPKTIFLPKVESVEDIDAVG